MCGSCWAEAGEPKIVNEKVMALQPLIDDIYSRHLSGAHLHIILDDWNVEDSHVETCREFSEREKGEDLELFGIEQRALDILQAMTEDERYSALALHGGFFQAKQG